MSNYFQSTMNGVGEKLNFARNTLMGRGKKIRDEKGFSYTADRILTSIGNFMDLGSTTKFSLNDAIANGMRAAGRRNFSASDLASVRDVDVADIAIATTVASHGLTYIAMERAMDSVAQQISFQGLRALNDVGGIKKGQRVVDPRQAYPVGTDFSRDGARIIKEITAAGDIFADDDKALPVVIGETKIEMSAMLGDKEIARSVIAFDAARNQNPQEEVRLVIFEADIIGNCKLNYGTGALNIKTFTAPSAYTVGDEDPGFLQGMGLTVGEDGCLYCHHHKVAESGETVTFKCFASFCVDRIAENDGAHTLKLKPYMESAELVSTENRVILQSSVEVQAQMNKVLRKNAQYGVNVDFGKRAIDQVVSLYTYFIDNMIVRKLWEGVGNHVEMHLDLKLFEGGAKNGGFANFVATKNDRLSLFTDNLCARFLNRTGSPVTALVVDEKAGLMYQSDKESFVADPAINMRRDGMIGTYKGIPVIRNVLLNGRDRDAEGNELGTVIGVFKSPDGSAAPVALGDYLPPYSTLPAVNANNPGELSQALFSQTACKCVVPEWAIHGTISTYGLGI
ncbi:MAG: hypothetical protein MJZ34_02825 [Paludibacteraceae bacterium]|nr:hypothetical protein [Paludibacteraceae bacterium]